MQHQRPGVLAEAEEFDARLSRLRRAIRQGSGCAGPDQRARFQSRLRGGSRGCNCPETGAADAKVPGTAAILFGPVPAFDRTWRVNERAGQIASGRDRHRPRGETLPSLRSTSARPPANLHDPCARWLNRPCPAGLRARLPEPSNVPLLRGRPMEMYSLSLAAPRCHDVRLQAWCGSGRLGFSMLAVLMRFFRCVRRRVFPCSGG